MNQMNTWLYLVTVAKIRCAAFAIAVEMRGPRGRSELIAMSLLRSNMNT